MESNVWSALHWLAPMGFYNEKQGLFNNLRNCIILLWIADNNSNVSSLIAIPGSPLSDFTQTSELQTIRKNKTEQQRELIINKSLPVSLLSLSHWPQDEPTYTAFTMKSVFFFSCLVSEISRSVWRDEMKCSELDLLLQHSQAPTAMELVTGVWLLHLSNPESNWFLQREGKDESCRTRQCTRHFITIKALLSFSISNNSWSNLIGIQVISFQKIEILNN